jgi:hypothetical protein
MQPWNLIYQWSRKLDCVWNVTAHAQKPDFVFRRNGRVHLNRRGHQSSRLLAAEVCASAVVMLDTPRSEVVWRILATHSIRQFLLQFPSRASPCAITFQLDSTSYYQWELYIWIDVTSWRDVRLSYSVLKQCSVVGSNRRFRGTCCLSIVDRKNCCRVDADVVRTNHQPQEEKKGRNYISLPLSITNKMQRYTIFFIAVSAQPDSGGFPPIIRSTNCTHSIWYMSSLHTATASGSS